MLSVRLLVFVLVFGFSVFGEETVNNDPQAKEEPLVTELVTLEVTHSDSDPPENDQEEPSSLPDLVDLSNPICNVCNCTEDTVNCENRDLRNPFEIEDWIGFRKSRFVTDLDLSNNHFVTLPQFPTLAIKTLNLSNCEIEILRDGAFSNLKYLTVLDLSRNKMSFVIGRRAFLGVPDDNMRPTPFMYLQHLSLAYNDIHSLSQDVFTYLPHLLFLDLTGNSLVTIDQVTMGALGDLMRLRELRMSECDLEALPTGLFRRLRRLQRLDLSGNRFTEVPRTLSEAINLQYLDFNRNQLQAISERTAISNLPRLQELHLSRLSQLRSIKKGGLGGLENLVKLHMTHNPRLTDLDPKFMEWEDELGVEKWPLLEELYLNNNNLSGINSRFLERWDHLTQADFSANPYVCDCNNQWMVKVLVPLVMGMANGSASRMICRRPYDYRGLNFAQLHELRKTLPCPLGQIVTESSSPEAAVLYGVLVGVLIAFPLVLTLFIIWKKGLFARCRKNMTRKDYYDDEEGDAF